MAAIKPQNVTPSSSPPGWTIEDWFELVVGEGDSFEKATQKLREEAGKSYAKANWITQFSYAITPNKAYASGIAVYAERIKP